MSVTVSDPIPVEGPRPGNILRVIACAEEGRVTLFVRQFGQPATINLDFSSARLLRAALPAPSPTLLAPRS